MATFDPKKARDEKPKYEGVPPGDYLLAIKKLDLKTSRAGNAYARCQVVVIAGAAVKKSFFDNISLDISNQGAAFRLSMLCEQCGVTEAFELDNEAELRSKLCGRPFKARVKREFANGYTNNGIERYLGDKVTDNERAVMEEWVAAQADNEEWSGGGGGSFRHDDDVPPPGDEDDFGAPSGRGRRPDDDIPF